MKLTTIQAEIAELVTKVETLISDAKSAEQIVDDVVDAVKSADALNITGSEKLNKVLGKVFALYEQYVENGAELKEVLNSLIDDVVAVLNAGAVVAGESKVWLSALVAAVKAKIKEVVAQLKEAWESIWDVFDGDEVAA